MNNNNLTPGTVVHAGLNNCAVIVSLPSQQPPGSVAIFSLHLNNISIYCKPERRDIVANPNPEPEINRLREQAQDIQEKIQYLQSVSLYLLYFADKIEAGEPVTEFPDGVDVRYVDYEGEPVPKNRVEFALQSINSGRLSGFCAGNREAG